VLHATLSAGDQQNSALIRGLRPNAWYQVRLQAIDGTGQVLLGRPVVFGTLKSIDRSIPLPALHKAGEGRSSERGITQSAALSDDTNNSAGGGGRSKVQEKEEEVSRLKVYIRDLLRREAENERRNNMLSQSKGAVSSEATAISSPVNSKTSNELPAPQALPHGWKKPAASAGRPRAASVFAPELEGASKSSTDPVISSSRQQIKQDQLQPVQVPAKVQTDLPIEFSTSAGTSRRISLGQPTPVHTYGASAFASRAKANPTMSKQASTTFGLSLSQTLPPAPSSPFAPSVAVFVSFCYCQPLSMSLAVC